jgi:hypothetical protein
MRCGSKFRQLSAGTECCRSGHPRRSMFPTRQRYTPWVTLLAARQTEQSPHGERSRSMGKNTRFVGPDVHAETIAVAEGRNQVRSLGTVANRPEAGRRLLGKLTRVYLEGNASNGKLGRSSRARPPAAACCDIAIGYAFLYSRAPVATISDARLGAFRNGTWSRSERSPPVTCAK